MKLLKKLLAAGLVLSAVLGVWHSAVFAGDGWLTSMDEAKKLAAKESRDILIDFSGSDWCGWCIKLDQEVFSTKEWAETGAKQFVMLLADFPNKKELPKSQKERNDKLQDEFGVQGFPTVFLLDADGAPYAKTGYQQGGPGKYLEHLGRLAGRKQEKKELIGLINQAADEEKPALLEQLIEKLNQWEVGFWYAGLKEETVKLDKDNQQGLRLKYAAELAYYYHGRKDQPKQDYYFAIVKKLSPEKTAQIELDFKIEELQGKYYRTQKWKEALAELETLAKSKYPAESAQKLYYQMALAHNGLQDQKAVLANLRKALDFAPDSRLGSEIKNIIKQLEGK
jgi:thioredoxin-related protein